MHSNSCRSGAADARHKEGEEVHTEQGALRVAQRAGYMEGARSRCSSSCCCRADAGGLQAERNAACKLSAQKQQRQQIEEELQQTIQALELKLVLTAQVKCTASSLQQLWSHDWILIFDVQAGAEGLMRKVALKMKNKELAGCVTEWRMTQQYQKAEHMAQERGEQIMKRVGMRMLNRDLSDRFMIWSSSWRADVAKQRGLGIMRWAGARMRVGELVEAIKNWQATAVHDVLEMVSLHAHVCVSLSFVIDIDFT